MPYKAIWKQRANDLPYHGVLMLSTVGNPAQKQALLFVVKLLAAEGHPIRVTPAWEVRSRPRHMQPELDLRRALSFACDIPATCRDHSSLEPCRQTQAERRLGFRLVEFVRCRR
jgi:hypothetical protein